MSLFMAANQKKTGRLVEHDDSSHDGAKRHG